VDEVAGENGDCLQRIIHITPKYKVNGLRNKMTYGKGANGAQARKKRMGHKWPWHAYIFVKYNI